MSSSSQACLVTPDGQRFRLVQSLVPDDFPDIGDPTQGEQEDSYTGSSDEDKVDLPPPASPEQQKDDEKSLSTEGSNETPKTVDSKLKDNKSEHGKDKTTKINKSSRESKSSTAQHHLKAAAASTTNGILRHHAVLGLSGGPPMHRGGLDMGYPPVPKGLPPPASPDTPTQTNGDVEVKKDKPKRIRGSRMEYKRLDELFNKNIHDFYLAETNSLTNSKEDVWEEFVFVVRRRFDWQNKYQLTYVDIKSTELRDILKTELKDINGISWAEDCPTVDPNLLFNFLPQLTKHLTTLTSQEKTEATTKSIDHLTLLLEYINKDYASTKKKLESLLSDASISYELLWALFLPNTLVYTLCPGSGEPRCLKLEWGDRVVTSQRDYFQLECTYIDYDGKKFGEAGTILEIDSFRGVHKINTIGIYPLKYHSDEKGIRETLVQRGKQFCELGTSGKEEQGGGCYRSYGGMAYYKKKRDLIKVNIQGRVMIDPATFRRINPNYKTAFIKPSRSSKTRSANPNKGVQLQDHLADPVFDELEEDFCGDNEDDDYDSTKPNKIKGSRISYKVNDKGVLELVQPEARTISKVKLDKDGGMDPQVMIEDQLLLCSATVLGFSFSDKIWAEFAVAHISPIEWNPGAFDSLVLPSAQKKIIKALVESHANRARESKVGFDDVIKGKGRGLVAVLHGRPGVGKTLTAEGISELLKRPLYMIGAGELGTDARVLETQLSSILDVAYNWGALLLLDEADVFLEKRSVHELHRNALVSIFLRLLEYFQGILFLTTNRVETFDEAFQSRIHIAIRYNDLDRKARVQIWKTFLDIAIKDEKGSSGGALQTAIPDDSKKSKNNIDVEAFGANELEYLARRNLNGRQIKNAVMTAQALALNQDEKLNMEHLKLVLDVTESFEHDLKGTGQIESMMSYA